MGEWQPIATAPKDGMRVLVYGTAIFEVGHSPDNPVMVVASYQYGYLWVAADVAPYETMIDPTHWMPLPVPPGA